MSNTDKPWKGISRRNFVAGSAISVVGVAAAGMIPGCSSKTNQPKTPATEGKASWETPPAAIPDTQIKETVNTEIVVVGGGVAGFVAALSAVEAGAKVIVLEKHTTSRAGGGFNGAIGSKMQKELGINIDKEKIMSLFMTRSEAIPDEALVRLWADHSGEVLDWLMDMTNAVGIKTAILQWPTPPGWDRDKERYGIYPTGHSIGIDRGDTQLPLLNTLKDNLLKKGAELRFSTPAVQLIREGKGRVTGVIAKNSKGEYVKFNAKKAVIMCSGDFGNDLEMMAKYCPPEMVELSRNANIYTSYMKEQPKEKLNLGDGHKMAMWSGAQMESGPVATMGWAVSPLEICLASFLQVNGAGERFQNEDTTFMYYPQIILKQPGKVAWQIFDAKYEEDYKKFKFFDLVGTAPIDDKIRARVESMCVKANTIEELAQKINVPVEAFKASVARRNELTKMGQDPDFGLSPDRLSTIEKGPFYAGKFQPSLAVTLGGIRVNKNLQPWDAEGKVIPGLYMAGNVVGGRYGLYYAAVTPGISNGFCFTHGYFAGKHAAAEQV